MSPPNKRYPKPGPHLFIPLPTKLVVMDKLSPFCALMDGLCHEGGWSTLYFNGYFSFENLSEKRGMDCPSITVGQSVVLSNKRLELCPN